MTKTYPHTTLIIAGHGSSKSPNQARPARKHAQDIRERGLFGDVKTAFWKEDVRLKDVLGQVTTEEVVIVPNLACSGHINKIVMPREMGLDGDFTERDGKRIHLCQPIGEHSGLPDLMAARIQKVMDDKGLSPKDTTVFLVAHGNPNPERPASHDTTLMMATRIYQHQPVHAILPAFIEEKPFLKGWQKRTDSPNILVLPFMIAAGIHGAKDIPNFLGITPTPEEEEAMHDFGTPIGPYEIHGRRLWLMRAMGNHPKMADFIIDIAIEKLENK